MKLKLRHMVHTDLETVLSIEKQVHSRPWTHGNFTDALNNGYTCQVCELEKTMLGYALLMRVVDEAHLLNISIAAPHQGQGIGRKLLNRMLEIAHCLHLKRVILEVRPSNGAAVRLYTKAGFRVLATRRGYYPSGSDREDAIVMEYCMTPA